MNVNDIDYAKFELKALADLRHLYTLWIFDWVKQENGWVTGRCQSASKAMKKAFPELTIVRGFYGIAEHIWLTALDGTVVDPTRAQYKHEAEYLPLEAGHEIRIGKCMNCGMEIYGKVEDPEPDPPMLVEGSFYATSMCSKECEDSFSDWADGGYQ